MQELTLSPLNAADRQPLAYSLSPNYKFHDVVHLRKQSIFQDQSYRKNKFREIKETNTKITQLMSVKFIIEIRQGCVQYRRAQGKGLPHCVQSTDERNQKRAQRH